MPAVPGAAALVIAGTAAFSVGSAALRTGRSARVAVGGSAFPLAGVPRAAGPLAGGSAARSRIAGSRIAVPSAASTAGAGVVIATGDPRATSVTGWVEESADQRQLPERLRAGHRHGDGQRMLRCVVQGV